MASPPWVTSARLVLRRPAIADAAAALAIMSDDRVVQHNPADRIESLAEAVTVVERWIVHWDRHGIGYACISRSGERRIIGFCGVTWTEVPKHDGRALNLMYRLAPDSWGQALAAEAASAVLQPVRQELPDALVVARVRPKNVRSVRVIEKLGLSRDTARDSDGADGLDLIYSSVPVPVRG